MLAGRSVVATTMGMVASGAVMATVIMGTNKAQRSECGEPNGSDQKCEFVHVGQQPLQILQGKGC